MYFQLDPTQKALFFQENLFRSGFYSFLSPSFIILMKNAIFYHSYLARLFFLSHGTSSTVVLMIFDLIHSSSCRFVASETQGRKGHFNVDCRKLLHGVFRGVIIRCISSIFQGCLSLFA